MLDISCAADVYSIMRQYVPDGAVQNVAQQVVEVLIDEGYSYDDIEEALYNFDEIYDAIESHENELVYDSEEDSEDQDDYQDE